MYRSKLTESITQEAERIHTSPPGRGGKGSHPGHRRRADRPGTGRCAAAGCPRSSPPDCGRAHPCGTHRPGGSAEQLLLVGGQLVPEGEGAGEALAVLTASGDGKDFRHLGSLLSQGLGGFGARQRTLVHGLGDLQKPAGAVSCRVKAGEQWSRIFPSVTMRFPSTSAPILRARAVLPQRPMRRTHPPLHNLAACQLDAGDFLFPQNSFHFFGADSHFWRELGRQRLAVQQSEALPWTQAGTSWRAYSPLPTTATSLPR